VDRRAPTGPSPAASKNSFKITEKWGQVLSKAIVALLLGCVAITNSCARKDAQRITQHHPRAPQGSPKVLAVYMPWFGDGSHMDVGYSSHDPQVLRRQIDEARNMGISGFVVDWYGDRRPFLDKSFALLEQVANEKHFHVALMYDETEDDNGEATEDAIRALTQAYQVYIGPKARARNAYLTYDGRPVIFVFPKHGHTNWNRVREQVNKWPSPPLLLYKDEPPAEFASNFDGYYAWVHPGSKGWAADGSNWGEPYLDDFYRNMKKKHPDKIVVGAAWPGFDDSHARWGLNRHMDSRCGKTLEDTMRLPRNYYDDSDPLPFLVIETWNDYEEGTAIEHRRFENCTNNAQRFDPQIK
jgi:hypothetical protein